MVMPSADRVLVTSLERTATGAHLVLRDVRRDGRIERAGGNRAATPDRSGGFARLASRRHAARRRLDRRASRRSAAVRTAIAGGAMRLRGFPGLLLARRRPAVRRSVVRHLLHGLAVVPRARLRGHLRPDAERAVRGVRARRSRRSSCSSSSTCGSRAAPIRRPQRRGRHRTGRPARLRSRPRRSPAWRCRSRRSSRSCSASPARATG